MRKPVKVTQVGHSSVVLHSEDTKHLTLIQLCELKDIIAQLQDIQARMEWPHTPDITGICTVCGNEVFRENDNA